MRLHDLSYRTGKLEYRSRHATEPEWTLSAYLAEAKQILHDAEREYPLMAPLGDAAISEDLEALRWFPLPEEILCELQGRTPATHCSFQLAAGQTSTQQGKGQKRSAQGSPETG